MQKKWKRKCKFLTHDNDCKAKHPFGLNLNTFWLFDNETHSEKQKNEKFKDEKNY